MPSPSTTNLPRPRSWEELEDICCDILRRLWKDPYVTRYGRSGQKQDGVDISGHPEHLGGAGSGKTSGAQCKNTDKLTLKEVEAEVAKAEKFEPKLSEYVVMTSAPRDAELQRAVAKLKGTFPVRMMFWEDISLTLSGYDDLLQKYFPGWMKKTVSKDQVLEMISNSMPEDFDYDDGTGIYVHKGDINLRLILNRDDESDRPFDEPWVRKFPDPEGTRQPVYVHYGQTRVLDMLFVYVDGGRHLLPIPKSRGDLTIDQFVYHLGCILNYPIRGDSFDSALSRAGITVRTNKDSH